VVRQFIPGGSLTTLAGGLSSPGYVDGSLSIARFYRPTGLLVENKSWQEQVPCSSDIEPTIGGDSPRCVPSTIIHLYTQLYVADTQNYVVRMICLGDPPDTGLCNINNVNTVSTVIGNHSEGYVNGPSSSSEFTYVNAMTPIAGNYYIGDGENGVIRSWDGTNVSTFAGTGSYGWSDGYRLNAQFNCPTKIAVDPSGNLYVVDMGNNVIRKIDTSGNVTTFAGTGQPGYADGAGSVAQFNFPSSIAFNPADSMLYVADSMNNSIRKIDLAGNVSTYAGTSTSGYTDGSLTNARFSCPMDLLIAGSLMYVSDTMNNSIRRIDMTNSVVSTYLN
jgi:sugar lactone lactonase YvrE